MSTPDPPLDDSPRSPARHTTRRADRRRASAAGTVPTSPVAKFRSLILAAVAAGLAVVLLAGVRQGPWVLAVVLLTVQVACVASWIVATDPPGPLIVGGVAVAVAVLADVGVLLWRVTSLAPVGYALVAGFLLAVVGQLARGDGRARVTEAFGASLALNLTVVGYSVALVLVRRHSWVVGLGVLAVGAAIAVARVVDIVPVGPRLAPEVPRSLSALAVGLLAGTGVAVLAGALRTDISTEACALTGLVAAGAALLADLTVSYVEADDGQEVGAGDTSWLASARGPLTAFAMAIPAVYVTGALVQSL